jgi:hypothetical protein
VPEAIVGDTSGSRFDTIDLLLEQKFDTGTYLSLAGEILHGKVSQLAGDFVYPFSTGDVSANPPNLPNGLHRNVDYIERSLTFTVDQLLGKQWTVGGRYRVSKVDANVNYPEVNPASLNPDFNLVNFPARQNLDSVLHTINLHANWNHPSGLFSMVEGNWYHQSNRGFDPVEPGDDFCQFNVYAGYRFWHRRAEVSVGLLNVFDQNYSLEPLNLYNEMARSRTFLARLLITF